MTYISMGAFLIVYVMISLYGIHYNSLKKELFSLHDSTVLKGMFCIIVVLVHIPTSYQNPIQDMMGSFAYIGVTFFFMTSSYGLKYSVKGKDNYLSTFWRKRLPAIVIPAFMCNLVAVVDDWIIGKNITPSSFIKINGWVSVLMLFYFIFWLVYIIKPGKGLIAKDIVICLLVVVCSLITKFTSINLTGIWPTESFGFAYGIILANVIDRIKVYSDKKWKFKAVLLFVLGGVMGVTYLKLKRMYFIGDYCLKILLGIVLISLVIHLTRRIDIGNKVVMYLGAISYEVYLLHGTVFRILGQTNIIHNSGIFVCSAIILVIALAAILNKIDRFLLKQVRKMI